MLLGRVLPSPRGPIVVQGSAVASSKSTSDELKYLRVYSNGPVYAPVTGYYSFVFDKSGIEYTEDPVLSGTDPRLFGTNLANLLTGRNPKGGSVELTLEQGCPRRRRIQGSDCTSLRAPDRRGGGARPDHRRDSCLRSLDTVLGPEQVGRRPGGRTKVQAITWNTYCDADAEGNPLGSMITCRNAEPGIRPDVSGRFHVQGDRLGGRVEGRRRRQIEKNQLPTQYYWPNGRWLRVRAPRTSNGPCIHNFTTASGPEECQPGSDERRR